MFTIAPRHRLAALAAVTGLLATAAPASAGIAVGNPGDPPAQKAQPPTNICAFPDVCRTVALNVPDVTVIPY